MSSNIGNSVKIQIFGESHGEAIGVVIDGLPAGEPLDLDTVTVQMNRRAPGRDKSATPRKESDTPRILSGTLNGKITGAPLCAIIENSNTRSGDYANLFDCPRPSHADYPAHIKYSGCNDLSGSGHFSGRLTAPLTFAGAVCRQILARRGITVGGHICSVGNIRDKSFDPCNISADDLKKLSEKPFSVCSDKIEAAMRNEIESARVDGDSVGGVVEIAAVGLPVGVGEPMFSGLESAISAIVFGVPAVKGVEFGAGFDIAEMRGTAANDRYCLKDGKVCTASNNNGGILGGISTGMPLIMRAAIKPTPSISAAQSTLNMTTGEQTELVIRGRHDPCIVPRALPAVEAAVCIALTDMMKAGGLL